jgi:hypothetical protein
VRSRIYSNGHVVSYNDSTDIQRFSRNIILIVSAGDGWVFEARDNVAELPTEMAYFSFMTSKQPLTDVESAMSTDEPMTFDNADNPTVPGTLPFEDVSPMMVGAPAPLVAMRSASDVVGSSMSQSPSLEYGIPEELRALTPRPQNEIVEEDLDDESELVCLQSNLKIKYTNVCDRILGNAVRPHP